MPRIKSDEAIDTSVKWDRASKVLRSRDSIDSTSPPFSDETKALTTLQASVATPTPTTTSSIIPNGSPVSPDDLERARSSDLPSKLPEAGPSNSTKDEDTSSVPVHQTDLPRTTSTGAGPQEVPVNDDLASTAQNAPPVLSLAILQDPIVPPPPIPGRSPLRYTHSAPVSVPTITSPASAPIPAPSGQSSSEPAAANPITTRFSRYRPSSFQQVDTQYQPYPPPGSYIQDSSMPPQMTYPQGAAPYFGDILHTHSDPIWKPQVTSTPQGSVTGVRPAAKGQSDVFVVDDPFRLHSNGKVQKLSNSTTFDDIPTDDSPSFRLSFGSAPGHESQPPYVSQSPQYQTSQPQPAGSYHTSQPTGSYRAPQPTGFYQEPTGPSQIPKRTGSYQAPQPTGSYPTSQPMGSYQVAQATGPYQPSQSVDPSQTSQPAGSSQATDLYQTPLPSNQEYYTSQPISPYQDQQAPPSTAPNQIPWLPSSEYQTQSVSSAAAQTSVSPLNQVQQPLPVPSTPQAPILPTQAQAPYTPPVASSPEQTPAPHVVPPYSHYQYSHPNAGDQMNVPAPSWGVPWGLDGAFITPPPTQMRYSSSFSSGPLTQQTLEAAEVWPQYTTDYEYPPETQPAFDLFPVEKKSLWSQIGDFFRWPFAWIRGGNELGGSFYYSTNTFFVTEEYGKVAGKFVLETLPRTMYIFLLLRLPSLYFGRVARIFEEADLSLPEIKKMAIETEVQGQFDFHTMEVNMVHPQYERLTTTWQSFVNDIIREWQTFNIVSVLLLS